MSVLILRSLWDKAKTCFITCLPVHKTQLWSRLSLQENSKQLSFIPARILWKGNCSQNSKWISYFTKSLIDFIVYSQSFGINLVKKLCRISSPPLFPNMMSCVSASFSTYPLEGLHPISSTHLVSPPSLCTEIRLHWTGYFISI